MQNKKEATAIIISIVLFTLLLIFNSNTLTYQKIPASIIISALIILVSVFAKKLTARRIDVSVSHKIWHMRRYWIGKSAYWRHPLPMGIILPALLGVLTGGFAKFLTLLQFDSEALPSKAAKSYGIRRFSTLTEWDDALIGFYGMLAVVFLAVISKFLTSLDFFPFIELSKYSLYYALYNIIPFSKLDGMKIFMGSKPLYVFSLIILAFASIAILI